eukprot:gene13186-biopygen1835
MTILAARWRPAPQVWRPAGGPGGILAALAALAARAGGPGGPLAASLAALAASWRPSQHCAKTKDTYRVRWKEEGDETSGIAAHHVKPFSEAHDAESAIHKGCRTQRRTVSHPQGMPPPRAQTAAAPLPPPAESEGAPESQPMPPLLAAGNKTGAPKQAQGPVKVSKCVKPKNQSDFVVLNWNADGLVTQCKPKADGPGAPQQAADRLQELRSYAAENRPAIMVITEPKLAYEEHKVVISVADGEISIPGYNTFRVDRDLRKAGKASGGGLVVYCKEELELVDEVCCQA